MVAVKVLMLLIVTNVELMEEVAGGGGCVYANEGARK
jgi:hypothetical protein